MLFRDTYDRTILQFIETSRGRIHKPHIDLVLRSFSNAFSGATIDNIFFSPNVFSGGLKCF